MSDTNDLNKNPEPEPKSGRSGGKKDAPAATDAPIVVMAQVEDGYRAVCDGLEAWAESVGVLQDMVRTTLAERGVTAEPVWRWA